MTSSTGGVTVELIAHRAGNGVDLVGPAAATGATIEIDLHLFRGRIEVRHAKVLWPFAKLWEKWYFLADQTRPPELSDILAAVPDRTALWLDLKGFTPRLARRVLKQVGTDRTVTASCRSWWALRVFRSARIRTMRSVGTRWQVWATRRIRRWSELDGIVMHERFATPKTMQALRRRTPVVYLWAVNDLPRAVELVQMGASGLTVDDLVLIAQIDSAVNRR